MQDEGTSHEDHLRKIIEEFVTDFNYYLTQLFSPSDIICSYEYISRWYGKGGHWINLGLLMYAAMDRKPENGEEIHNYAYDRLVIMMRLRIVKYAMNEAEQEDDEDNLPCDTKVLKELVLP